MNNTDVRQLTDTQLEVIAELALDFPDEDVELIERIDLNEDWLDYSDYGYSISYMVAVNEDLFTVHVSQFQGVSVMSLDREDGGLDFMTTFNQFAIVDYIRNVYNNIVN